MKFEKWRAFLSFLKSYIYIVRGMRYEKRKDYDQAIQITSRSLVGSKQDIWPLYMIALYNHSAKRDDLAIEAAKKAIAFDPTSFETTQLLVYIFAKRSDHDSAAHYIRLGLDNASESFPEISRSYFSRLRFLSIFSSRFKHLSVQAEKDLGNLNQSREEWKTWAKKYLVWYDTTYPGNKNAGS